MSEIFSTTEQATEFTVTIVTGRGRSTRTATSAIMEINAIEPAN